LADPQRGLLALDRVAARPSLETFIRFGWSVLEPPSRVFQGNWHITALSDHLMAVSRAEITRLLINVPPGSMKSLAVAVGWPAWEWGPLAQPGSRFISASYSQRLSLRDNIKCRRLIRSPWYQARWGQNFALSRDQNSKERFDNDRTGFRLATSVGGLGTGERGDRFIIDDPHNVQQADSAAVREATLRWFDETVPTRLNDPARSAIVVVMQRVHERDISGHILARELGYEQLVLPMEFEPARACVTALGFRDPRRHAGELLWPARFSRAQVAQLKTSLGDYASAGQLQQRPVPRQGGLFQRRWFSVVKAIPAAVQRVRHWDLAASAARVGRDPDWTVGLLLARDAQGSFFLEDIQRLRADGPDVRRAIATTAQSDGQAVQISLPQDPGQAGKVQAQDFARLLAGWRLTIERETGDKVTRAEPAAAQAEAGNIKLLKAPWNDAFLEEAAMFPNSAHKDQIDALSGALAVLAAKPLRWFR
jgi:predicted phage terminase large subunit-like protein|tara:strand:+ start:1600 stop:3036 length:1437 start_codon:yes stop_codon:yes gene_type:complete